MEDFMKNTADTYIDMIFGKNKKKKCDKIIKEDGVSLLIFNSIKINKSFYQKFINFYSQCAHNEPIIIELTTTGGKITWAYMVAQILLNHKAEVTIRIPCYALSSGTIIALAANKIVFSHTGCLGPIDPYIYGINIPTSTKVLQEYNRKKGWFKWLLSSPWANLISKYSETMLSRVNDDHQHFIKKILRKADPNKTEEEIHNIYDFFTNSNHHGTPIYKSDIPETFGLDITIDDELLQKIYKRNTENTDKNPEYKPKPYSDYYGQYSNEQQTKDLLNNFQQNHLKYINSSTKTPDIIEEKTNVSPKVQEQVSTETDSSSYSDGSVTSVYDDDDSTMIYSEEPLHIVHNDKELYEKTHHLKQQMDELKALQDLKKKENKIKIDKTEMFEDQDNERLSNIYFGYYKKQKDLLEANNAIDEESEDDDFTICNTIKNLEERLKGLGENSDPNVYMEGDLNYTGDNLSPEERTNISNEVVVDGE